MNKGVFRREKFLGGDFWPKYKGNTKEIQRNLFLPAKSFGGYFYRQNTKENTKKSSKQTFLARQNVFWAKRFQGKNAKEIQNKRQRNNWHGNVLAGNFIGKMLRKYKENEQERILAREISSGRKTI